MSGKIKLNAASGGGSVAFEGPASQSSDKIIKFPNAHGVITQIVQTYKTTAFTSTANNTYTDITGMNVSITPTSTSSKVLVSVILNVGNSASNLMNFRLLRGSTVIGADTFATDQNGFALLDQASYDVDNRGVGNLKCEFLDSPSSTSSQTYKIQFTKNTTGGTGTLTVNRRQLNSFTGTTSSITAYEVAS